MRNLQFLTLKMSELVGCNPESGKFEIVNTNLFNQILDLIFVCNHSLNKEKDWESQKHFWLNYFGWIGQFKRSSGEITLVYYQQKLIGFSTIRALFKPCIADFCVFIDPNFERPGVGKKLLADQARKFPRCRMFTITADSGILELGDEAFGKRASPIVQNGEFAELSAEPFKLNPGLNWQKYVGVWATIFSSKKVNFLPTGVVRGYFKTVANKCTEKNLLNGTTTLPLQREDAVCCFWYNLRD